MLSGSDEFGGVGKIRRVLYMNEINPFGFPIPANDITY